MSVDWSYRLAVGLDGGGALDWSTDTTDPAPLDFTTGGAPGLVLDGLQLVRKLPEDEPWPCQPQPSTLVFQVAAATANELASQLTMGAPVAFRMGQWLDLGPHYALADSFTGYISSVTMESRWDPQLGTYTVATVTAMDWVAALAEVVIGDEVWPLEGAPNRFTRVLELVYEDAPELVAGGWDYETLSDVTPDGSHIGLAVTDVDARPALEVLLEILSAWTKLVGGYQNNYTYARYQLVPYHAGWGASMVATDGTDGWSGGGGGTFTDLLRVDGWRLRARPAADMDTPPPAVFADLGGGEWGIQLDPIRATVPAGAVELPVRWAQRIGEVPNAAAVTVPFAGYTAGQGQYTWRWKLPLAERPHRVRIKRTVPIEFSTADDAYYIDGVTATHQLATILIPDTVNPDTAWGTEDLEWHAAAEDVWRYWPFNLGDLITVTDVPPAAHPTGARWIHGQLDAYTVTITDGMPVVKFSTRPQLRDSMNIDVLTFEALPAGVTFDELDPTMTIHDLRLLRATP